jgi:hypothetical protein
VIGSGCNDFDVEWSRAIQFGVDLEHSIFKLVTSRARETFPEIFPVFYHRNLLLLVKPSTNAGEFALILMKIIEVPNGAIVTFGNKVDQVLLLKTFLGLDMVK